MNTDDLDLILNNIELADSLFSKEKKTKMAMKSVIEAKASEYIDLLEENPSLETEALAYVEPERIVSKRAMHYREDKILIKEIAAEIIAHLAQEPQLVKGKLVTKRLTPLEEEVRQILLEAQDMGIKIPIEFKGKKDPKLEALKQSLNDSKIESQEKSDLEKIQTIVNSLSSEERSSMEEIASKILEEFESKSINLIGESKQ